MMTLEFEPLTVVSGFRDFKQEGILYKDKNNDFTFWVKLHGVIMRVVVADVGYKVSRVAVDSFLHADKVTVKPCICNEECMTLVKTLDELILSKGGLLCG